MLRNREYGHSLSGTILFGPTSVNGTGAFFAAPTGQRASRLDGHCAPTPAELVTTANYRAPDLHRSSVRVCFGRVQHLRPSHAAATAYSDVGPANTHRGRPHRQSLT